MYTIQLLHHPLVVEMGMHFHSPQVVGRVNAPPFCGTVRCPPQVDPAGGDSEARNDTVI